MKNQSGFTVVAALLLLSACATRPPATPALPEKPSIAVPSQPASPVALLKPSPWNAVAGWSEDDIQPAWDAFLRSCTVLKNQPLWQEPCTEAGYFQGRSGEALRQFFESRFVPHQVLNPDGSGEGLITGYYEPLLRGSRTPSKRYRY